MRGRTCKRGDGGSKLRAMKCLLLVGLGGGLGALGRYGLGVWLADIFHTPKFPFPTFFINLLGCLLIGILYGLHFHHSQFTKPAQLFIFTGILGGFTTFSTFGWETLTLLQNGNPRGAFLYGGGSIVLGLLAVWLGYALCGGAKA
jgi:CrcB protein